MAETNTERLDRIKARGIINLPRSEELWLLYLVDQLMSEHHCKQEQVKLWGDAGGNSWGHCEVCDAEYDSVDQIPEKYQETTV